MLCCRNSNFILFFSCFAFFLFFNWPFKLDPVEKYFQHQGSSFLHLLYLCSRGIVLPAAHSRFLSEHEFRVVLHINLFISEQIII